MLVCMHLFYSPYMSIHLHSQLWMSFRFAIKSPPPDANKSISIVFLNHINNYEWSEKSRLTSLAYCQHSLKNTNNKWCEARDVNGQLLVWSMCRCLELVKVELMQCLVTIWMHSWPFSWRLWWLTTHPHLLVWATSERWVPASVPTTGSHWLNQL